MDLGIVPQGAARREMNSTDDWDALSPAEQQYEAKRMAVYAGMVSAMDAEIGRLQNFLAERGELANTLFILHQIMELKRAARPNKIPPAIAGLYLVRATRSTSPH